MMEGTEQGVPVEVLRRFHSTRDRSARQQEDLNFQRLVQFIDKPFTQLGLPPPTRSMEQQDQQHPRDGATAQEPQHAWVHGVHVRCTDTMQVPELASALGPKSRFGDGDGSFWDTWLNTTGVETQSGYLPSNLPPLLHQLEAPRSGFKRAFMPVTKKMPPLIQANPRRTFVKRSTLRRSFNATPKHKVAAFMASRTSTLSTLCTDEGSLPEEHTNDHSDIGFDVDAGQPADLTPKQRINYFGDEARGFFYDTYQQMARTKQQVLDFESMQGARSTGGDADDRARPLSSRARFVGNCVAHDLLPRACLVIRRNVTTELKLQHQGIGDKMAILLAKSLKDMPYLMKADLRCNRLTDAGLLPLLEALADNESVRDVNIGGNKLGGKTLDCLVDTLSEPKCLWKALSLPNVQLTDEQCQRLVVTLKTNTTLTELNLQENLIARDAFANQESAGTAALAELLESAKCRLQKLNIGWNFVRLNSAQVLGASLRTNCSLTLLDLSHNKLGDAGAYQLANSLRYNRHLNELRLGHTAISSCAAFGLAVALDKNRTVRLVDFTGNPIGQRSHHELMELPTRSGGRLKVMLGTPHNDRGDEEVCWFDPSSSRGGFLLDLFDPYQYAVATCMLRLAAEQQVILSNCAYVHNHTRQPLELVAMHQVVPVHTIDSNPLLKENAVDMAMWYFDKYDRDGSGSIDEEELQALLEDVGAMDVSDAKWILCIYDIDGSGSIERNEFLEFFVQLVQQLKGMTVQASFMGIAGTNREYVLDHEGFLEIDIQENEAQSKAPPNSAQLMSSALSGEMTGADRVEMIEAALARLRLGASQAQRLFQILSAEIESKVEAIARILPRLTCPSEGRRFVERNQTTPEERSYLRLLLGDAHDILVGLLTGHHRLDLSDSLDRIALERLLELDESQRAARQQQHIGDTSQARTFSGFRNAAIDGKRVVIEKAFRPNSFPESGVVEFDYVHLHPPTPAAIPLSDSRFFKALVLLHLARNAERDHFLSELVEHARRFEAPWEPSREHATAVAQHLAKLRASSPAPRPKAAKITPSHSEPPPVAEAPVPRQRKRVLSFEVANAIDQQAIDNIVEQATGQQPTTKSYAHWQEFAIAAAYLFSSRWLYCYQVRILLQRAAHHIRSDDHAARVELLVRLFTSILDLVNFHQVLEVLTPEEHATLLHRIGYLNVWNPVYPDGYIELDLSDPEQKQVARMLLHLSVAEDGENMLDQSMRPTPFAAPNTSWRMPVEWFEEKNWPDSGIIKMKYFSGAGEGLAGCQPDAPTRDGLMSLVYALVLEEHVSVEEGGRWEEGDGDERQYAHGPTTEEDKRAKRTMQPHWCKGTYRVGILSVRGAQPSIEDAYALAREQGLDLCYR